MTSEQAVHAAQAAETLLKTITGRGWAGGSQPGSLSALDQQMRPIESLTAAGLAMLVSQVQPMQQVLDRMAGKAAVIRSFAETWQRVSTGVREVRDQLARTAQAQTADWTGDSADRYRNRAGDLGEALRATAELATAMSAAATIMGETVAGARTRANELLQDLVRRLIAYVQQAKAAEGGLTANVMAQATQLVSSYSQPIADIEKTLRQTVDTFESQISTAGLGPQWTSNRDWYTSPAGTPTIPAGAGSPPTQQDGGWFGRGGAYLDGQNIVLRPRDTTVPGVVIPNNTGAKGFEVGPGYDIVSKEHTYRVNYSTDIPFGQGARLVGDAIGRNPVPTFADQPSSTTGSRNDALWGDYVKSYRIASPDPSKYTDITVNYTIAGEHRLHEGYVIRYGERDESGNVRLVSYGEGNSPLQHPANLVNQAGVQAAWTLTHREISVDVHDRLRAQQPAR